MRKLRLFYIVCLTLSIFSSLSFEAQDPNVIFIISDDLKYFDFSSDDCPVHAPNLKALAEKSASFSDAHANLPICAPSRASFLSGKYGHSSGYFGYQQNFNLWYEFPDLHPDSSIFGHFKSYGYRTISAGKVFHEGPDSIYQNSFDNYKKWNHGPFVYDGTSTTVYPDNPYGGQQTYISAGPIVELPGDSLLWIVDNTGEFEVIGDSLLELTPDELISETAIEELTQTQNDPFFMTLGYYRPHLPFYAPQEFFDLYELDSIVIPEYLNDDILRSAIASFYNGWGSSSEDLYLFLKEQSDGMAIEDHWIKRFIQAYYASVSFMDHQVGKVLDALDSSEFANNTVVLFTSDHAIYLGEYSKMGNKNGLRDPSTRIPLMISGPGIPEDTVISHPISLIDVYPTLSDIALGELPDGIDGHSLMPLIDQSFGNWAGTDMVLQEITTREHIEPGTEANNDHQHFSILSSDYRYSIFNDGEEELYDRNTDPNEIFNIAYVAGNGATKAALRNELEFLSGAQSLEYDPNNNLVYGGFEQDYSGWAIGSFQGSNLAYINDSDLNDKHCVAEKNSTAFAYIQNQSIFLEEGHSYIVSFSAKHNTGNATLKALLVENKDLAPFAVITQNIFEISDQWQQYEFVYTHDLSSTKRTSAFRVVFEDLGIYEVDDVHIADQSCDESNFLNSASGLDMSFVGDELKFHWNELPFSRKCELQRNESSATFGVNYSDLIPEGNDLSFDPPIETTLYPINTPLENGGIFEYGIEYRWKIRCGCSTDPIVVSPFSGVQFFTIPPLSSLDISENDLGSVIFPNPNSSEFLHIEAYDLISISVYDLTLKLMDKHITDRSKDRHSINISTLEKGSYIVLLEHSDSIEKEHLIKL